MIYITNIRNQNDFLMHHGILGQKWGVRRYQNEDGSYTQAGLERYRKTRDYYDSAKRDYRKAKRDYKEGRIGESKLLERKKDYKLAKRELNRDYKQLEKDRLADRGKDLYSEGKTVEGYNAKQGFFNIGAMAAAGIAGVAAAKTGKTIVAKLGETVVEAPAGAVAAYATLGAAAVAGGVYFHKKRKQLRAYYGHSRPKSKLNKKSGEGDSNP